MKRIYLDNAASTPVDAHVRRAVETYWKEHYGNAGGIHSEGVYAKNKLNEARTSVARFLSAHPDEIIFTGSGTEANNIAIQGIFENLDKPLSSYHAITISIEHPSVLRVFNQLEQKGLRVSYIPPQSNGAVDSKEIKKAIRKNTILISVMHANNEIGTRQPIEEIAKIIRAHKKACTGNVSGPFFHTDACQTLLYCDTNVARLGVDILSASSSKFYGPKGVGVLYVKRGTPLAPIMFGGSQEHGLRPGTENIPNIIGCACALEITNKQKDKEKKRLDVLRTYFVDAIEKAIPDAVLNGDRNSSVPSIVSFSFPGIESERMILELDARGIAVASRSACNEEMEKPSHVIMSLGKSHYPESAIRFSMGRETTKKDLTYVVKNIKEIVGSLEKEHALEKKINA